MKAQTARTTGDYPGAPDQVTPVIIKFAGGGGGGGEATLAPPAQVVSVSSDFMPFDDPSGPIWETAKSTFSGRIHELTLRDGGPQPIFCSVTPRPDAAVSLEIDYIIGTGTETLTAQEAPNGGVFFLEITSSNVPFEVTEPATGLGWFESKAKLGGMPKRVVFKQTDIKTGEDTFKLEYACQSANVALNLDFRTDEVQPITE